MAEGAKASRFPSEILAAQSGAGEPYEEEDFGADSLQMKPSASTLTFCSQSRPSAGSVQAYHVFLPREGGAGRLNDTHPVLDEWRSAPLIALYSEYLAAIHIERIRRVSPLHVREALTLLLGYARPPPPESQRTTSSQDLCRDADGGGRPSP